jgi:hypothetical protein
MYACIYDMYIYVYMVLKAYVNFSARVCVCAFDAVVVVVSCYVYFYVCSFPSLWLQHGTSFGFTLAESDLAMEDPPGLDHENLFNIGIFYC